MAKKPDLWHFRRGKGQEEKDKYLIINSAKFGVFLSQAYRRAEIRDSREVGTCSGSLRSVLHRPMQHVASASEARCLARRKISCKHFTQYFSITVHSGRTARQDSVHHAAKHRNTMEELWRNTPKTHVRPPKCLKHPRNNEAPLDILRRKEYKECTFQRRVEFRIFTKNQSHRKSPFL